MVFGGHATFVERVLSIQEAGNQCPPLPLWPNLFWKPKRFTFVRDFQTAESFAVPLMWNVDKPWFEPVASS